MNFKGFFNQKTLTVISVIAVVSLAYLLFAQDEHQAESYVEDSILKAVIIDQLHDEIPNEAFLQESQQYLERAGYQVDIVYTKDITIDFYKKLPEKNYKFVLVRTHGVADESNEKAMLFTGERYTEDKYISEQLFGHIERATPFLEVKFEPEDSALSEWTIVNDSYRILKSPVKSSEKSQDEYFVIPPKFVSESMEGKFANTIFLLGGCSTASNPSLANALIERGASEVIGWDDKIGAYDNDAIMLQLLEQTLIHNIDTNKAVEIVMQKNNFMQDRFYSGILKHYS